MSRKRHERLVAVGLADREYMRERASPGSVPDTRIKFIIVALAAAVLMAVFAWLERPDFFKAIGLPNASPDLAFPASGTAAYAEGRPPRNAVSFVVQDLSGDKLEKVIRFRTPDSRTFVAEMYLRPGDKGEIHLPPGVYRMHLMQGHVWRGPDVHFGAGAATFDMGVTAIGGDVGGMDILPPSVAGESTPIAGTRF